MFVRLQNPAKSIAVVAVFLLLSTGCRFYFKTTKDHFTVPASPALQAKGKNLVFTICGGCHYDPGVQAFIGKSLNDLPPIAGHLYSANLTHSVTQGRPSQYTDAELFYLLKTGIARNGRFMPYMMKPMMADEDVKAIIAFLRSDDPSLAARDTSVGHTRINWIGKTGLRLAARPQPYTRGVPQPDENDPRAYGRYLVGIIGCYHCHSAKLMGLNFLEPEKSKGYLQGGIKLKTRGGKKISGPNLTPDVETGIGNFSREDFGKAVRQGKTPSGAELRPPMDRFSSLTDQQVNAIFAYLKSLPPVHHAVRDEP